jgi:transcriptional regulator with XRE-family HTH domain
VPSPGEIVRATRARHRLSQQSLARRARTTQRHVSRIERGEISPSFETLARLLAAMGEQLEIQAVPGPVSNRSSGELQADYRQLSPSECVAQTAALSHTVTSLAASRRSA